MKGEAGKRQALAKFETMNQRVCRSAEELNSTLKQMADLLPDMIDELLREVVEILFLDLAGEGSPPTPIKSGRARSGWVVDVTESEWVPPNMDTSPKSDEEILAAVRTALDRLSMSSIYYLYNNVPYLLVLERGHSKQAPNGFIAIALANLTVELRARIAEFRNASPKSS